MNDKDNKKSIRRVSPKKLKTKFLRQEKTEIKSRDLRLWIRGDIPRTMKLKRGKLYKISDTKYK